MVSSISKMDRSHEGVLSHRTKLDKIILKDFFCFANISAWENDNTLVFLSEDAPSKALQSAVWASSYWFPPIIFLVG